ncbi:protein-glutamate O-methyltransferase [bacterium]|nr:protein-glutamate O-methyltransferase [bacterium]
MINSFGAMSNFYAQQKQSMVRERYNDIYAHEMAHKSAAGELGGPIVIERDSNGIPVGGHVNITMPVLDKNNPENTIKHADKVIKSAMAPSDPSAQDYRVAAAAKSVKSQAIAEKNKQSGQKLNLFA